MSEPKPDILVCVLLSEIKFVADGNVRGHFCAGCNKELVIGPSGQRVLVKWPETPAVCTPCGKKRMDEFGGHCDVLPAPGAVKEAREHFRREEAKARSKHRMN